MTEIIDGEKAQAILSLLAEQEISYETLVNRFDDLQEQNAGLHVQLNQAHEANLEMMALRRTEREAFDAEIRAMLDDIDATLVPENLTIDNILAAKEGNARRRELFRALWSAYPKVKAVHMNGFHRQDATRSIFDGFRLDLGGMQPGQFVNALMEEITRRIEGKPSTGDNE